MFQKLRKLFSKAPPPFIPEMPLIGPPGPASVSPPFEGSDDTVEFLWEHTQCSCNSSNTIHRLSCAKWQGLLTLSRARRCGY